MPDLKLVPRPEGFELRDRRSDKSNSADDWTPRDALYAAHEAMGDKCDAVAIIWREKREDGTYAPLRRNAGPKGAALDLTVSSLGIEMGWAR